MAFIAVAAATFLLGTTANAGIIVGSSNAANGGNDPKSEVLNVIDAYNLANDPDLFDDETLIALFKKTDDDAAFVFDMNNGFMFFEDAAGTMPITSEGGSNGLTEQEEAYFKYTGSENILFYSVKGSNADGFTLYTFMPGLNLLDVDPFLDGNSEISHVSFWTGPPGIDPFGDQIPEPASALLAGLGLAAAAAWHRKTRAA